VGGAEGVSGTQAAANSRVMAYKKYSKVLLLIFNSSKLFLAAISSFAEFCR